MILNTLNFTLTYKLTFLTISKTLFVVLKVTSKIQCYLKFKKEVLFVLCFTTNIITELNTLNFTLTVTLFAYPFKTDVGYSDEK
jgi:hypothetical protein